MDGVRITVFHHIHVLLYTSNNKVLPPAAFYAEAERHVQAIAKAS